jgi:hypothetical protein
MESLHLQVLGTAHFLEPIAGPLTLIVMVALVIFAVSRRLKYRRRLINAITRPTIIYRQEPTASPYIPSKIDYSITPADPRFYTLPWEYKEALYVNRINQLSSKCREMQKKLKAAGIK